MGTSSLPPSTKQPSVPAEQRESKDNQPRLRASKTEPLNKRRLPKFEVPRFRSLNDNRHLLSLCRHRSTPPQSPTSPIDASSLLTKPLPEIPPLPQTLTIADISPATRLDAAAHVHSPPPHPCWLTVSDQCSYIRTRCATLLRDHDEGTTLGWSHTTRLVAMLENVVQQVSAMETLTDHAFRAAQTLERLRHFCKERQGDRTETIREVSALSDKLMNASAASLSPTSLVPMLADEYIAETPQHLITSKSTSHVEDGAALQQSLPDYASQQPEHIDPGASWFRTYFIGKPYITLVGSSPSTIVSAACQDNGTYRIVIRSTSKKYAGYHLLGADQRVKSHRHAVNLVCPSINTRDFRLLSAQDTILTGVEKELLRLEEISTSKHYKFGVLCVRKGQTTEEEWFSNSALSPDMEQLLDLLGERVTLEGYSGYAGGLDTKAGESGPISYASRWGKHDIMFHVGPLMPLRKNDTQQVHRKRHIGNDIVCLVFVEAGAVFDPAKIRSQFLHVFVAVQRKGDGWRVEVIRNRKVSSFGPVVPSPEQLQSDKFRDFVLLKMINGENAALKSDRFAIPNDKAREGILNDMVTRLLSYQQRLQRKKDVSEFDTVPSRSERPRSAGPSSTWRPSLDSIPIPPIPSPSRSTILRDLRDGIAARRRRRGSGSSTTQSQDLREQKAITRTTAADGRPPSFSRRIGRVKRTDSAPVTAI